MPYKSKKIKKLNYLEEFIELKNNNPYIENTFYLFPADNYEGLICSFIECIESQNRLLRNGDSVQLNTPEARKALQLLVDLVHKYHITPPVVTNFDEIQCYNYFLKK